jgi:hypothetical protein
MEISRTERKAIRKMWKEGANVKAIAAAMRHGTKQIQRITRGVKRNPCGCGRDGGHKGRCWFKTPAASHVPILTPAADGPKRIVPSVVMRSRQTVPTQTTAIISASNRAKKVNKGPFRMMSTRGPDPYAALRIQQIANASKGRL